MLTLHSVDWNTKISNILLHIKNIKLLHIIIPI